jgi:hypothetical protein
MCWVALDRGITIARRFGFDAPLTHWQEESDRIRKDILANGFDHASNSFVQKYGSVEFDASLLLLPIVGFLPIEDPRIQGTIKACKEKLMVHGFLLRYTAEDGLKGEEGSFVLCNFWLAECLALSGKIVEALALLDETVTASNHLGLFSEEFDSTSLEMLGNFPQAFSHIGYINAVMAILAAQSRLNETEKERSLKEQLRKIIPFQVILNPGSNTEQKGTIDLGTELKKKLGRLQGAFFNKKTGMVNYEALKHSEAFRLYLELAGTTKRKKLSGSTFTTSSLSTASLSSTSKALYMKFLIFSDGSAIQSADSFIHLTISNTAFSGKTAPIPFFPLNRFPFSINAAGLLLHHSITVSILHSSAQLHPALP